MTYEKQQTLSVKLSWSHYCELLSISDVDKRSFYEKECIASGWSVRELKRQKESSLFEYDGDLRFDDYLSMSSRELLVELSGNYRIGLISKWTTPYQGYQVVKQRCAPVYILSTREDAISAFKSYLASICTLMQNEKDGLGDLMLDPAYRESIKDKVNSQTTE